MPEYEVRNDILQTTARALYEFCPPLLHRLGLQDMVAGRFYPEGATSKIILREEDVAEVIVELKNVEAKFGKEMFFGRLPIGSATTVWRTLIANLGVGVFSTDSYDTIAVFSEE